MRLLERESQLVALSQYAEDARHGHGRLVLLSGEAGVGKSAMLERLAQQLSEARWLWGACDGLFTPPALGPLLDIAGQLGGELMDVLRADVPRGQLFASLLHQLAERPGLTVMAVEDIHWADEATLDLLRYLGRRIQHLNVLLVVTYRDDAIAADHPMRLALGSLATQRATRRLDLPTLSAAAVTALAEGSGIAPSELYRLTGGNPFFVTEVLQTGLGAVPASARDAVLARVASLSPPAREALEMAALMGSRVQVDLLTATVAAGPAVIDELLRCGILVGDGYHLRFRHEIARVAVESAIAPHRAPAAHATILDALRASGGADEARLAFHAEGSGNAAAVLAYAPGAGRRASELAAHRESAAQYERALRFADGVDARTRATLSDALAYELALIDRWQDSAEIREQGLRLWREVGDPVREGDSLRRLSRAMWRLCRGPESGQASEAAMALLKPLGPSREGAWAYANLANHLGNGGSYAEAIAIAGRAQQLAETLGLPDVLSDAVNTEGGAVRAIGGEWTGLMRRAVAVAVDGDHEEQAGRAFANTYSMYCADLRHVEAEQHYDEALAYCDDHDIGTFGVCLLGERAAVMEKLGRWDEAETQCRRLLEAGSVSPANRLKVLCTLGKIRARRAGGGVWGYLDQAMASAAGLGEPEWLMLAGLARTEAYWLEGRLDDASRELDRMGDVLPRADVMQRSWLALWVWRISGTADPPTIEPFRGQLTGNAEEAARRWDHLGCPYEAALALADSTEDALLRRALDRLADLGAVTTARLVRRRMRELGLRSIPTGARPATSAHPRGLTAREQEVLQLVCDGRTNDEISGTLVISVKTVDHHVSALLHKLGVPSRTAAAVEARRLGLSGSVAGATHAQSG